MGDLFDDDDDQDEPCRNGKPGCRGHMRLVRLQPCPARPSREVVTLRCDGCGDELTFARPVHTAPAA